MSLATFNSKFFIFAFSAFLHFFLIGIIYDYKISNYGDKNVDKSLLQNFTNENFFKNYAQMYISQKSKKTISHQRNNVSSESEKFYLNKSDKILEISSNKLLEMTKIKLKSTKSTVNKSKSINSQQKEKNFVKYQNTQKVKKYHFKNNIKNFNKLEIKKINSVSNFEPDKEINQLFSNNNNKILNKKKISSNENNINNINKFEILSSSYQKVINKKERKEISKVISKKNNELKKHIIEDKKINELETISSVSLKKINNKNSNGIDVKKIINPPKKVRPQANFNQKSKYAEIVLKKIENQKKFRSEKKGNALVRIKIKKNGELSNVKILKSSGSLRDDRKAINQIKKSAPFPIPPKKKEITFEIKLKW